MQKQVGIVGMGYVGSAMQDFFVEHYVVTRYDKAWNNGNGNPRTTTHEDYQAKINACDVGIICVPTPQAKDGSCDISAVKDVLSWLETPLIILKSTVPPGTTQKLIDKTLKEQIVFSPEFCGESSYWTPYEFHSKVVETPFFIFGGQQEFTTQCVDLYMQVAGPTKRYIQTHTVHAEMMKYVENCFYATKIIFCHEIERICKAAGLDYNVVRELWLNDPRVNPMHTAVFESNKDKKYAFGGKCLPKDLSALIKLSQEMGYEPYFLKEVQRSNVRIGFVRAKES